MASASEVILPIGTQKHDPAWKHCLMVRSGGRTKLKCKYCTKDFLGGGIHRIKEHLARHKGNASCCPKVPSEVQQAMQQSLEGATVRKRKKQKLVEEVRKLNPNQLEAGDAEAGPLDLTQLQGALDAGAIQVEVKEEGTAKAPPPERGRRRRTRYSPSPVTQVACLPLPLTISEPNSRSISGQMMMNKDQACMAIGRFLYDVGVPLDAVNSVHFQPMVDAIAAAGPGLQVPSYHEFRGTILKRCIGEVTGLLEQCKASWARTGCSVMADEWTTETGKTLINFLVYCPEGTMFLKSVDATHIVTSPDTLYELLKHVVEEVGVRNVVQVITSSSVCHAVAGKRLTETFPTLFWTPCVSQCVDAALDDIAKQEGITETIESAKTVAAFVYNHAPVLNMMKQYTNGKELLLPGGNRSAMNFVALKSMVGLKDELTAMVSSEEWMVCPYSKKPAGVAFADLVGSAGFWASCSAIARLTEPLVRFLKLADSVRRPATGYIYVGLYQVKEAMKKVLVKKQDYMPYWDIIDWRWDRRISRPLHAAGFFLNPQFFYSIQGEMSNEVSSAMLDCIERLVPEVKVQDKIQKELNMYKSAAGDFGRKMAIRARQTLLPAEWWATYGGGCPNLTRLAIRILSQTCSARGFERNRIAFEQIHNRRMNFLEHQRLCDLLFVRYNLRLQQRQLLKSKVFDPLSVDNIDVVDDWIVDKSEMLSADEDSSWMVLNQPTENRGLSDYSYEDDAEAFILGLDDEVVRRAGQDIEEDDDDMKEEEDGHDGVTFP
ncbi:uncharacterized protein M6B38_275030 [Iris pallida]|uniref:BED-type domain-containing protein n=1 Tax=Iris pallida TaxID=29817 RepID=A0AAX6I5P3_IRIPA|nr:uncharacterized protein M6B38_275030 [Iris pallida]